MSTEFMGFYMMLQIGLTMISYVTYGRFAYMFRRVVFAQYFKSTYSTA